ncbi:MAG: pitrilysin family protein [Deltaproteobacteria bacterium]|nr:pitrilysin family protein [Deltaproteobacteria bacterium]
MKPIVSLLDNGLVLVLAETHAAPVTAFQMWVGVGSADETPAEAGLAHVFEHMLFKGTKRRGVGEIPRDVERAGGRINAWTSHDETVFHITLASRFWEEGLDILGDAIANTALDRDELTRELAVILEEIRMGEDSPERVVIQDLFRGVFRRHPYGRPVIGFGKTVKSFTREVVADFYARWYTPSNMVLVVAGDFDPRLVSRRVRKTFARFRARPVPKRVTRKPEPTQRASRVSHTTRPVAEAHVSLGFPAPGLVHEDVPALDLLAAVLGQGASSRLETRVRREAGLVSEVRAMAYTPRDAGLLAVSATLPPSRIGKAVESLLAETLRLARELVGPEELEKARNMLESDAIYSEETVDGMARKLGFYQLHAGDVGFEARYLAALGRLDPAELLAAARRYLVPQRVTVSLVMPEHVRARADLRGALAAGRRGATGLRRNAKPTVEVAVTRLPTGDVLIVRPDAGRVVAVRAAFLGGQRAERPQEIGLSTLLASSITRGTVRRSAQSVAVTMDRLACSIGGFAGRNTFGMQGEFLEKGLREGFALLAECLREPGFAEAEVTREKELLLDEIRASRDNLSQQAFELFQAGLFGGHPYGRPLLGTERTVSSFRASHLRSLLAACTPAGAMVLAVVGAADPGEIAAMVEERMAGVRAKGRAVAAPEEWERPKRPRQVVRAVDKEQSHVVVGFPGTRLSSDDRFAVEVLVEILGGHGGRLFGDVRERRGLAYSVTAASMDGIEPGYVAFYAATSPGQEREVLAAMARHARLIRDQKPPAEELRRVKTHLVGSQAISLQRNSARASGMALGHLYGLGHDAADRYPGRIQAVTAEAVVEAARRYLDLDRAVVACVGPGADRLDLVGGAQKAATRT